MQKHDTSFCDASHSADGVATKGVVVSAPLSKDSSSFCPASHPAESLPRPTWYSRSSERDPVLSLLRSVAFDKRSLSVKEVLYTSFPTNLYLTRDVICERNVLVETAINAYNYHHKLAARPDDVWLSYSSIRDVCHSRRETLRCGIPKVTLEGEKEDWETILVRIEQLKKYGVRTITWYHLLRPIIAHFITANDEPGHRDNLEFWNKISHCESASGPQYLSGWITAFCVFTERGESQGGTLCEDCVPLLPADEHSPSHLASEDMVHNCAPYLVSDGVPYPTIDGKDIPCGYVSLNVMLDDNGQVMDTMFIAGSIGSQICSREETGSSQNGSRDTIRLLAAWWYFVEHEGEEPDDDSDSSM